MKTANTTTKAIETKEQQDIRSFNEMLLAPLKDTPEEKAKVARIKNWLKKK